MRHEVHGGHADQVVDRDRDLKELETQVKTEAVGLDSVSNHTKFNEF